MKPLALLLLPAALAPMAELRWRRLPDLPRALGGQFVGVASGQLIVAGGSAWDRPPWENGTKLWADEIYALSPGAGSWRLAGRLPQPMAYGASVNAGNAMLLFGGQSSSALLDSVLLLAMTNGRAEIRRLGKLPSPMAMMSAVVAGGIVYLAGGQPTHAPTQALRRFLSVPLEDLLAGRGVWKELPPWDGPPRFFAQAASCGGVVYLAGGSDLVPGPAEQPARRFLHDAHRYTASKGWERLPDMPRAAQAGLAACESGRFYVFGGSDGTVSEQLREKHPGFRRDVLEYDPQARRWSEAGRMPASLVTTGITSWEGEYVIAGGEDRPGHRSAAVIATRAGGLPK